ncbi:MAG: 50S ribosome-binding GTPase [Lachnospiraceae bacterium]|nr:50S ribosome-binding GTPase [Lachnospiraceae bacterium]
MEKANVLVMGNSGTGKSTLINAVFKFDRAKTGGGPAVTREMAIYESEQIPFRAIDTRGLEYGLLEQMKTKNAIRKWSKESVKAHNEERYIHLIWYCLDGTSKRIFKKNLETLKQVSKLWKDIPIIVVLTKSYSQTERLENEAMIRAAIDNYMKNSLNVKAIVSVVAQPYQINEAVIVPPMGLEELIGETNNVVPEALRLSEHAVTDFERRIKRGNANALTAAATVSATLIGAIPIPIADSALLVPLQSGLVFGIARTYGVKKDDSGIKNIAELVIQSGMVSVGAKTLLSGLKAVPGINIAADVLNAAVAGTITAIVGQVAATIMERVDSGEVSVDDLDWMKKFAENEFGKLAGNYVKGLGGSLDGKGVKDIGKLIVRIFENLNR